MIKTAHLPSNWKSFLQVEENKVELLSFLAEQVAKVHVESKELYTTYGESVEFHLNRMTCLF